MTEHPCPTCKGVPGYEAPHCDPRILHAPGACRYCDDFPDRQKVRRQWSISFTGVSAPGMLPCPADAARRDTHTKWHGNVAVSND